LIAIQEHRGYDVKYMGIKTNIKKKDYIVPPTPSKTSVYGFNTLMYASKLGHFQKIGEIRDLIPQFKKFYYEIKKKTKQKYSSIKIITEFQDVIDPETFCPFPNQYQMWRRKWDLDISDQLYNEKHGGAPDKRVVKFVEEEAPSESDLELGTKTLAGELINDAARILKKDQELEEIFTPDELMKRRTYILNVMTHVTKLVQGKEGLKLKASANQRENAGFLMDLLRQASSGTISPETIAILKGSIVTPTTENNVQS